MVNSNGRSAPHDLKLLFACANCGSRVRYQLMEATPLDYKMEGNRLAEMIRQLGV